MTERDTNYLNETGPGQYNINDMTGKHSVADSRKRSGPAFTMGGKPLAGSKLPLISKAHMSELQGRDTPGIGAYDTQNISPRKIIGGSFSTTRRFSVDKERTQGGRRPHGYLGLELRARNGSSSIGMEKRFKKHDNNPMYIETESPGPGRYDMSI